ncbi:MAG: RusA family crossover junction endodeoxyribonuclease [Gallionella sp.]
MITLRLPVPPSANRYWRTYMPKGFKAPVTTLSAEAKAYKIEVASLAKAAGIHKPILGRVSVSFVYYPKRPQDWQKRARIDPQGWDDTVMALDLDNLNKGLLDALKNVVFEDDKLVHEIHAKRMEPDGEARVIVTITPIVVAAQKELV